VGTASLGSQAALGVFWLILPCFRWDGWVRTESFIMLRKTRSSGVPTMRMICSSWSWLSRPRKSGTPVIISAKIQPQDQISIDVLYVREPSKTSGARYQSVTTYGGALSHLAQPPTRTVDTPRLRTCSQVHRKREPDQNHRA
jgi:hypothetical protein